MNISDFLKLFLDEEHGTGYIESPLDTRDISFATVAKNTNIPEKYFTDVSKLPILDQRRLGACVGHAFANYINYFELQEGRKPEVSARYIYAMCKLLDGLQGEGTFPRVGANVLKNFGASSTSFVPNDTRLSHSEYIKINGKNDASLRKIKAYAFVPNNIEMVKQAIFENKVIGIAIKTNRAYHYVLAYGYDEEYIYYVNSWGKFWGNRGLGKISIEKELFDARDIITLVDITPEQLEEAKQPTKWKYFAEHEVYKLDKKLVDMLDKAREIAGIPFVITSGFRTPEHNARVGGEPNSAHLRGLAADLRCRNSEERFAIVNALLKVGFNRIGIGSSFIHCDIDPTLPQNVMWTY